MDKAELETLLARIDVWLLIFGAIVVIGVAGESVFGIRHWWNSRKLQAIQNSENLALQAEIARLNKEAADAKLKLEEVRKRQEPRAVPVETLNKMLKSVSPPPPGKVIVEYSEGDPETFAFTMLLWNMCLRSVWDVPEPKGLVAPRTPSGSRGGSGITLVMYDLNNPPPYGRILWQAFMTMGGSVEKDQALPPDTVLILIGPRL